MNSSRDSVSFSDAPDAVDDDAVDDDDEEEVDDGDDDGVEADAVVVVVVSVAVDLSLSRFKDGGTITGKVNDVVTGGERVYEADALTILLFELSEEFRDSLGLIVNVAVISLFISSVFGFGDGILSLSFDGLGVVVVVVDDVDGVFCDSVSVCI